MVNWPTVEDVKRQVFCQLIPLHKGKPQPNHEEGTVVFECNRCGAEVWETESSDLETLKEYRDRREDR